MGNWPHIVYSASEWSRWVRDALIWLGEADPCATMDQVRDADPRLEALTMVIEQWQAVLGQRRVSVKEVIDSAVEQRQASFVGRPEFIYPDFREALLAVAGDGGAINGRRLGKWLAANQNRIIDGMKIISDGVLTGIMRWRLANREDTSAWKMRRDEACRNVPIVDTLDVDHCFPWAAWPCEDLWNLLPAHRITNQIQKRNKLPSADLLYAAKDRIQEWWNTGYLKADKTVLPDRFITEARATLSLLGSNETNLDDVYTALTLQQARLKYDQQVPVWEPSVPA